VEVRGKSAVLLFTIRKGRNMEKGLPSLEQKVLGRMKYEREATETGWGRSSRTLPSSLQQKKKVRKVGSKGREESREWANGRLLGQTGGTVGLYLNCVLGGNEGGREVYPVLKGRIVEEFNHMEEQTEWSLKFYKAKLTQRITK